MVVNYIYNEKGLAEYVVIPMQLWQLFQQQLPDLALPKSEIKSKKIFNPLKYKGLIKNLNINIEQELKNMREEWTTDF